MENVEFSITGFGFAAHSLTADQKATIKSIAERLFSGDDQLPSLRTAGVVEIIGHALGTSNLEIHANKRAEAVLEELRGRLRRLGATDRELAKLRLGEPVTRQSSGPAKVGDRKVLIAVRGGDAPPSSDRPGKKVASNIKALLIVPNQGHAHRSFLAVARKLNKEVYGGRARVVRATVPSSSNIGVTMEVDGGGSFSWSDHAKLRTVMVLSHAGPCDGPNLDHDNTGEQPWRVKKGTACTDEAELIPAGVRFWGKVGEVLAENGKAILLSCHCGENNYASLAATAAGHTVFAANGDFSAAHGGAAVEHVRRMEAGRTTHIFKKFKPVE